jgi:hypothetical protein
MWCFDLAYVDRNSWKNYVNMFEDITNLNNLNTDPATDEHAFILNNNVLNRMQENRIGHNRAIDCEELHGETDLL